MSELTLEILDQAIRQIEESDKHNEIVGFKVNPTDYEAIKNKTAAICGVANGMLFMTLPYMGFQIIKDINIPPGFPQPIRAGE